MKLCGKRYVLFLLLFSVLLSPTFSEEVSEECKELITEEELIELEAILLRHLTRLNEQATLIETLESQLVIASEQREISQTSTETLQLTLTKLEGSYNEQERVCRRRILKTAGIAALISAAVAFVAGLLL